MDTIIGHELFKYLGPADIKTVSLIGPDYARAVRHFLPEILRILAQKPCGRALIRAAIRAGKNMALERAAKHIPFAPLLGGWALELANSGFAEFCWAAGHFLVPLMYQAAIRAQNDLFRDKLGPIAYGDRALADYQRYLRLKYPLFGPAVGHMRTNLHEFYAKAAAEVSFSPPFDGLRSISDKIVKKLHKNPNIQFIIKILERYSDNVLHIYVLNCFEYACSSGNLGLVFALLDNENWNIHENFVAKNIIKFQNIEITKVIGEKYNFDDHALTDALEEAYRMGYRPNIDYLLEKIVYGQSNKIAGTFASGQIDRIKEMLAEMPDYKPTSYDYKRLGHSNNLEAIKYVLGRLGPAHINSILKGNIEVSGNHIADLVGLGASLRPEFHKKLISAGHLPNIFKAIELGMEPGPLFHKACNWEKYGIIHALLMSGVPIKYSPRIYKHARKNHIYAIKVLCTIIGAPPDE